MLWWFKGGEMMGTTGRSTPPQSSMIVKIYLGDVFLHNVTRVHINFTALLVQRTLKPHTITCFPQP